jgi:hypothetical protein
VNDPHWSDDLPGILIAILVASYSFGVLGWTLMTLLKGILP